LTVGSTYSILIYLKSNDVQNRKNEMKTIKPLLEVSSINQWIRCPASSLMSENKGGVEEQGVPIEQLEVNVVNSLTKVSGVLFHHVVSMKYVTGEEGEVTGNFLLHGDFGLSVVIRNDPYRSEDRYRLQGIMLALGYILSKGGNLSDWTVNILVLPAYNGLYVEGLLVSDLLGTLCQIRYAANSAYYLSTVDNLGAHTRPGRQCIDCAAIAKCDGVLWYIAKDLQDHATHKGDCFDNTIPIMESWMKAMKRRLP